MADNIVWMFLLILIQEEFIFLERHFCVFLIQYHHCLTLSLATNCNIYFCGSQEVCCFEIYFALILEYYYYLDVVLSNILHSSCISLHILKYLQRRFLSGGLLN